MQSVLFVVQHRSFFIWAWLCVLVVVSSGCGKSGPPKYRVSGQVTWEGQPIPAGDIILEPTGQGLPDHGKIVAGKFDLEATAGPKKVQILATREGEFDPEMGMARRESYIPLEYNSKTKLTAEVQSNNDNQLRFDLPQ